MGKDFRGAEPAGQLGLGTETGHHGHGHAGIQRPQDGDRAQPQRAGPVHQHRARIGRGWRVTACRDTENGSANTATSSGIESGTANSMLSWAGINSA